MGTETDKHSLSKLFRAYDKAYFALVSERDERFPPGTEVRSRINPDLTVIVKDGSLYADQVLTEFGHMSWRYLEKVYPSPGPSPTSSRTAYASHSRDTEGKPS